MKRFRLFSAWVVFMLLIAGLAMPAQASRQPTAPPADQHTPAATSVSLNPFSTGPSYDSGWRSIDPGQTLSMWHQLGLPPALLLVQLETRKYGSAIGIEQRFIGGNDLGIYSSVFGPPEAQVGAFWHNLTSNYVLVTRNPQDTTLDAVRLRIWAMGAEADYSQWVTLDPGEYTYFTHNLGGDPEEYVVDMLFNDTATGGWGVNQRAYGGRTLGSLSTFFNDGARVGAYWYGLAENVIYVLRMNDDEYADEILLRIWKRQKATYDSGWVGINQGRTHLFIHNIGGNPEDYRVDMEFKTSPPWLVNQCFYGGNDIGPQITIPSSADNYRVGAFWTGLTQQSITVYRREEDVCAEQVRIRIWNFWTPTQPDIDSGWKSITPDTMGGFTHGLPDDKFDKTLVDFQFKDSGSFNIGIHQRGLGGMDWTDGGRIGGYYINLGTSMFFLRRTEDADAPYMRARLWYMPKPAYDSGWQDVSTIDVLPFYHELGGNPADYLVDLQFKNSTGDAHLIGYGGYDSIYLGPGMGDRQGAFWFGLTDNAILISRLPEDTFIKYARIRIWTLARPDYDSGMALTPTGTTTFTHNLGGSPDNYLLNLVFNNSSGSLGPNQMYYGGNVFSSQPVGGHNPGDMVGGFWRDLRSTNVDFLRQYDDTWIDEARLRIWQIKLKVFLPKVNR